MQPCHPCNPCQTSGKAYTLITGATGFIGAHVADALLKDGTWPVMAIARGREGYKNTRHLEEQGAFLVCGLFYDPDVLSRVFSNYPIQNVVHIAALTGDGKARQEDYEKINVQGTERLLAVSHRYGVDKFVFCSSVGVFGTVPPDAPAGLGTRLSPDNVYHRSKLRAEQRVHVYIERGLNAFIIRPTIAYGLGDTGFPSTLVRMVRKRLLPLPFQDNRIHLVSVTSLAEMFVNILKATGLSNRVFIAADEGPVLLRDLVNRIHSFYFRRDYPRFLRLPNGVFAAFESLFGKVGLTRWVGRFQRLSRDWFFDTRSTDSLIGFRPACTDQEFLSYLMSLT